MNEQIMNEKTMNKYSVTLELGPDADGFTFVQCSLVEVIEATSIIDAFKKANELESEINKISDYETSFFVADVHRM